MSSGRLHITGKYLPQHIDKNVVIEGFLTKVSSDGLNVELTTFDQIKVNASLNAPLDGIADGIIQIFGTVKSKTTISVSSYCIFPADDEDFDPEDHNDLMTALYVTGRQNILESCDYIVAEAADGMGDSSFQAADYSEDM